MRIIHCADLHLDSPMSTHLDREKARQRKNELLNTFANMVAYATEIGAAAILIAGDLFDGTNITKTARNVVIDAIESHPDIIFFYLKGNHDRNNFLGDADELPVNLKLFNDNWTSYALSNVVRITGMELHDNCSFAYESLILEPGCFNIVTLHGQNSVARAGDRTEIININELKNKNIDYLALGHVHTPKIDRLDVRGTYAYPGCLEGRGFDECGNHGFLLLDIDEDKRTFDVKFIKAAQRTLHLIETDVSGLDGTVEMLEKINSSLLKSGISKNDMVKIVLSGEVDVEADKNKEYILNAIKGDYYFVKISDMTHYAINPERYAFDESLKGEFVRTVQSRNDLSPEEKAEIIRYGFLALEGGDLI